MTRPAQLILYRFGGSLFFGIFIHPTQPFQFMQRIQQAMSTSMGFFISNYIFIYSKLFQFHCVRSNWYITYLYIEMWYTTHYGLINRFSRWS